jgi:hypothetical protein
MPYGDQRLPGSGRSDAKRRSDDICASPWRRRATRARRPNGSQTALTRAADAHGNDCSRPLADKEDERFQAAAARWHARFVLEANLPLREAEGMMTLLCRLRGADRQVVRRRLLLSVERAGLTTREIS